MVPVNLEIPPESNDRVNRRTLNERVYDMLRQMILSGRLALGSQLDEQSLADRLGVSRTPLREAIAKLVKECLVVHQPWKGNFVWMPTAKEANDLFEVRKALEALAVQFAIPNLSDGQLVTLREILADVDAALVAHDVEAYGVADRRFHSAIALFSGNLVLVEALNSLGSRIHLIRNLVNRDPRAAELAARERPHILSALTDRDGVLAAELMREHIGHVQHHAVNDLQQRERRMELSDAREAIAAGSN